MASNRKSLQFICEESADPFRGKAIHTHNDFLDICSRLLNSLIKEAQKGRSGIRGRFLNKYVEYLLQKCYYWKFNEKSQKIAGKGDFKRKFLLRTL